MLPTCWFPSLAKCAPHYLGVYPNRSIRGFGSAPNGSVQGCGIKGFLPTSVIQENPPLYETSLWEGLSVVSQKWIPFPTALGLSVLRLFLTRNPIGWVPYLKGPIPKNHLGRVWANNSLFLVSSFKGLRLLFSKRKPEIVKGPPEAGSLKDGG